MNEYCDLAYVYDKLTFDVDYDGYADFIEKILEAYKIKPELMVDLACGTGSMHSILTSRGYDVIGIDSSIPMLEVARNKCENSLFLNQDITEFELYGTVDVILCLLDSVNYITDKRRLKNMFCLVENYLNYGGVFIFDINSPYKLRKILGNNTYVYEKDNVFYTWENELCRDKVNFFLNFFVKQSDETYARFEEVHTERIYEQSDIADMLNDVGLDLCGIYSDFEFNKPTKTSDRIIFVAKKRSSD